MKERKEKNGRCPYCGFDPENCAENPRWLPPGHILNGKYLLGKVLGEGGFGITYIGWDLNLEVRVAIKEYFPVGLATREVTEDHHYSLLALTGEKREIYQHELKRFVEEARSLSRFYHLDGIVAVKDFFFENETAYMVMEFLDGVTLKQYLKSRGECIPADEVLELMQPVLQSLEVVHEAGIIHRDISPDNIMITPSKEAKLIDFGAARMTGNGSNHTFTIVLKHGYAPPEQYLSKGNQGPWTDVYAICATMYRMITGQLPPGAMDRMSKDTLVPFSMFDVRVPSGAANAILKKGLALSLQQRYQSIEELYEDLYRNHKRKRKRYLCLAVLVGMIAAGIPAFFAGVSLLRGGGKNTAAVEERTEPEAVSESEPKPEVESKPGSEPEVEAEPEVEPEPEADVEPEVGSEPEAEPKPEAEPEPKADVEPEVEAEPETESVQEVCYAVDESVFPDEGFRSYVQEYIDQDKDGRLTQEELLSVTEIDVSGMAGYGAIQNLQGVELFSALERLDCSGNQLDSLDVNENTDLKRLDCYGNQLTELKLDRNQKLEWLDCSSNQLSTLKLDGNTALTMLDCRENRMELLDIGRNRMLIVVETDDGIQINR